MSQQQPSSSAVFLNSQVLDDYLTPSAACVNPLFTSTKKEETNGSLTAQNGSSTAQPRSDETVGTIIPRKKRRQRRPLLGSEDGSRARQPISLSNQDTSTAAPLSIADCLACSGCITTAETVLLQQHEAAVQALIDSPTTQTRVLTISPSSLADLWRHLAVEPSEGSDILARQLVTLLQETLDISVVLDGAVPLAWSRRVAVDEFCQRYREKHATKSGGDDRMDVDDRDGMDMETSMDDGAVPSANENVPLPLLSSSCPALVCWVETSLPTAVPHLSTVKSSMALGGAFFHGADVFHIAVMPCHDKKLEGSRTNGDVAIVLTTRECLELMQQVLSKKRATTSLSMEDLRQHLLSRPLANVVYDHEWTTHHAANSNSHSTFITEPPSTTSTALTNKNENDTFFPWSSGGYAETLFVQAARQLFSVDIERVEWQPVVSNRPSASSSFPKQSARVAAAAKQGTGRRRDLYQATLYRLSNGQYTCTPPSSLDNGNVAPEPVLRFAVAYGMQTLQRVLRSFESNTLPEFDYLEVMACPSGCLNGGGQIRLSERETPRETHQRVDQTRRLFSCRPSSSTTMSPTITTPPHSVSSAELHTSFRVVPPMQLSSGAAAGVAVKDTLW